MFVNLILPLSVDQEFTYSVSDHEINHLYVGSRVVVPFGKSKFYTGIVTSIHKNTPQTYLAKPILSILDNYSLITAFQLDFWRWVAQYYMAPIGVVVKDAIPSGFLLQSQTVFVKNNKVSYLDLELKDDEYLIGEALERQAVLSIKDIANIVDKKNVLSLIKRLIAHQLIVVQEEIVEKDYSKKIDVVVLAIEVDELQDVLNSFSARAVKQKDLLLCFFSIQSDYKNAQVPVLDLLKKSGLNRSVLKALISKGILNKLVVDKPYQLDLQEDKYLRQEDLLPLTVQQQQAFQALKQTMFKFRVTVLRLDLIADIDKQRFFIELIKERLALGKQVLWVVPEISLAIQLVFSVKSFFTTDFLMYHSRITSSERCRVWNQVLKYDSTQTKGQLIIGTKIAKDLPFKSLDLVILDQEHDYNYKQSLRSPRVHTRDALLYLANKLNVQILLSSITPSLELIQNVKDRRYGYFELKPYSSKKLLPDIEIVDLTKKYQRKEITGHFTDTLTEAIHDTIARKEQVLLFQHKRGYAPTVHCKSCGSVPQCPNCDVSLTFHLKQRKLRCHYCGYHTLMSDRCGVCQSMELDTKGFGTEQIETELYDLFSNYKIARMDQDTTKSRKALLNLLDQFNTQQVQILIGTQLMAKGLSFRNVGLVGVLNADYVLHTPDFRACERSFQFLMQIAQNISSPNSRGKVLLQSFIPHHRILQQVSTLDYHQMCKEQLEERCQFLYPPFSRLIRIELTHKSLEVLQMSTQWLHKVLLPIFKDQLLGPEFPSIAKLRNKYRMHFLLKLNKDQSIYKSKQTLLKVQQHFTATKAFAAVNFVIDVDFY